MDEWEIREPFRSQGGRLILLCNRDVIEGAHTFCHLVSFSPNIVRRVCRSTIQAESYQLQLSVEHAGLIRASIVDAMGLLNRREWEDSAASVIPSVWFTDCRSAHQALQRPVQKGVDKRLGIELAALRQSLWRYPGRTALEARLQDGPPAEPTDRCRWIDTLVMLADPLTKVMNDAFLQSVLDSNHWDFTQTMEAKAIKQRKQQQRKAKRAEDAEADDEFTGT